MDISTFVLNKTEVKTEEYKTLFKKNSLKRCEKYFLQLNKLKTDVEKLVKSFKSIPLEIFKELQNSYNKFCHCFFNEKTLKSAKKEKIDLNVFLNDMKETYDQMENYKKKIGEINFILKVFIPSDNYIIFLNFWQNLCKDFINKYKKYVK